MPTVDELARDVIASIATDANALAAAKWIDNRYKEMMSRVRFRHLRQVGELSVPGIYDTGTIAATRGSTAITGTATQFQTDIGLGAQQYLLVASTDAVCRFLQRDIGFRHGVHAPTIRQAQIARRHPCALAAACAASNAGVQSRAWSTRDTRPSAR